MALLRLVVCLLLGLRQSTALPTLANPSPATKVTKLTLDSLEGSAASANSVVYVQKDGRIMQEGQNGYIDVTDTFVSNHPVDPLPSLTKGSTTSGTSAPVNEVFLQRDGRMVMEGANGVIDVTGNIVANHPVDPPPQTSPIIDTALTSSASTAKTLAASSSTYVEPNSASKAASKVPGDTSATSVSVTVTNTKATAPSKAASNTVTTPSKVLYLQRDGLVMKSGSNGGLVDITDTFLSHHPGAGSPGGPETPVTFIETNALTQHLPNGTKIGELNLGQVSELKEAYPWNALVAESPASWTGPRRSKKSIDQILETSYEGSPTILNYPTVSGDLITELDMRMTMDQYIYYYEDGRMVTGTGTGKAPLRTKRKALKFDFTYWPDGIIPYNIDNSFTAPEKTLLQASMDDWMAKTCVRFVPASPDHVGDLLNIKGGRGCNSFVGRIGGDQTLNLQKACRENHVMTHELGHVLGLIHEHQRPDRDNFITVATQNVGSGRTKNYHKFNLDKVNTLNVEYDYTSIMHYGKTAFSKDDVSTTMITKNPDFQDIIGTTSVVSFKDAKIVNEMYKCAAACPVKLNCGDGFMDKTCRCVCPDGTQTCDARARRRLERVRPINRNGNVRRALQQHQQQHLQQQLRRQQQQQQNFRTQRRGPVQRRVTTSNTGRNIVRAIPRNNGNLSIRPSQTARGSIIPYGVSRIGGLSSSRQGNIGVAASGNNARIGIAPVQTQIQHQRPAMTYTRVPNRQVVYRPQTSRTTIQQPSRTIQQPLRTVHQPLRTIHQPLRTIQQPSRTIQQASRTIQQPSRTIQQPSRIFRMQPSRTLQRTITASPMYRGPTLADLYPGLFPSLSGGLYRQNVDYSNQPLGYQQGPLSSEQLLYEILGKSFR